VSQESSPIVDDGGGTPLPAPAVGGPGGPPRDFTPHVLRQSWREPRVRFWWLMAAIMTVVALSISIIETIRWSREAWLVNRGTVVQAKTYDHEGHIGGRRINPDILIDLEYEVAGKPYQVTGFLPVQEGFLRNGGTITIRVDPDRPWQWTNRSASPSLRRELVGAIFLLPLIVIALLVGLYLRRRTLALWQRGEAEAVIVVDAKQTALAPRSWYVRCAWRDRRERALVAVYIPQRLARFSGGELIWLITWPSNPFRAIPAVVYQD
jgi:hypothetical protein